jgi:heme/copper-type cytochrome/quinol oxidase subunit 2
MFHRLILLSAALSCGLILNQTPAQAADMPVYKLTIKNHIFEPAHFEVPAGTRFKIELTSHDDTADEFESHDMKFEKIIVPGATITVFAGPLHPGTYTFVDDYRPDTKGTVTAIEQKD